MIAEQICFHFTVMVSLDISRLIKDKMIPG